MAQENKKSAADTDSRFEELNREIASLQQQLKEKTELMQALEEERSVSQQARKESETRFQQIADILPEVFWIADWEGDERKVSYVNSAFETIFSRSCEEFYQDGMVWLERVHINDRENVRATLSEAYQARCNYTFECRLYQPDGGLRWILVEAFLYSPADGDKLREIGLVLDISERKQLDNEKFHHARLFEGLFQGSRDGIVFTDAEGNIADANQSFLDLLGYSKAEIRELKISDITPEHWQLEQVDENMVTQLLQRGFSYTCEKELERKDGSAIPVEVNGYLISGDGEHEPLMWTVVRDIRERRKSIEKLRYYGDFENLLTSISTRFLTLAPEEIDVEIENALREIGRFIRVGSGHVYLIAEDGSSCDLSYFWSDQHQEIEAKMLINLERPSLDCWRNQILANEPVNYVIDEPAPEGFEAITELMASQIPVSFVDVPISWGQKVVGALGFSSTQKDKFWTDEEVIFLRMFGQIIIGALQRKKTEAALIVAKEKAEAANQAKDEFLAVMTHEMRTPLNPIMGFASIMLESCENTEFREYLDLIMVSSQNLLSLIQDVLNFTKIEKGKIELEAEEFELADLLEKMVALVEPQSRGNKIRLRSGTLEPDYLKADHALRVVGDPGKLGQVILNLVTNACKFTDDGKIDILYGIKRESNSTCSVRFSVRDNGVGMDEDQVASMFNPFIQGDSSYTRRHGGIGLGLAICDRIVNAMGGSIGAESIKNQGSHFWFVLPFETPLEENASLESLPVPTEETSFQKTGRIMIVEDNPANQQVTSVLVKRLGFETMVAGNGLECLDLLSRNEFDMILMDISMPEMDGFEATRRIRQLNSSKARVPIIATTAHASDKVLRQCAEVGMNDSVCKPVTPSLLTRIIKKWYHGA